MDERVQVLVFDSGIGGLTIVEALRAARPGLAVAYCADTGFFPYGDKPDAELARRIPDIIERAVDRTGPAIVVIACNTASTLALEAVRARLSIPVVGTVPGIKPACEQTKTGVVGFLATPGTLRRRYTEDLIERFSKGATILTHGSTELVRLAERAAGGDAPPSIEVDDALAPLLAHPDRPRMDTLILGCTHFPLLRKDIARSFGPGVTLLDTGEAIARRTLSLLPEQKPEPTPAPLALLTTPPDTSPGLVATLARFGFPTVRQL